MTWRELLASVIAAGGVPDDYDIVVRPAFYSDTVVLAREVCGDVRINHVHRLVVIEAPCPDVDL